MSESEQREIEQEAVKYVSIVRPGSFPNGRQEGYIAGATAMAEKKCEEIKELKVAVEKRNEQLSNQHNGLVHLKAQLEAAQSEVVKWKSWYERVSNEYGSMEIEIKDIQAELKRVKEVAEKMAEVLKGHLWNNGAKEATSVKNSAHSYTEGMNTESGESVEKKDKPEFQDIIKFLLGESSFYGIWFGEKHPTEPGLFWWRKHLKAYIDRLNQSTPKE